MQKFQKILQDVDATYRQLPDDIMLRIQKIAGALPESGLRKLRRSGSGFEFFQARDFINGVDDPMRRDVALSERAGKDVVREQQAEICHHFFLWRDASASMDYTSIPGGLTKRHAAEVMLLAFARHLARNEENISLLNHRGLFHGGRVAQAILPHMDTVNILTGGFPALRRKPPQHSTTIMFSDFLMPLDEINRGLSQFSGYNLHGVLIMVLDPQEIDFTFKGPVRFSGKEGEGKIHFQQAEEHRDAYQKKITAHIDAVKSLCAANRFRFIMQRTDAPLHNGLRAIYQLPPIAEIPLQPRIG